MNLEAYLHRIGYTGSRTPSLETLSAVQEAHLNAIPYENLDIHLGRRLEVNPERAYEKIVLGGRGGWCFEMNTLLGWALETLGFEVAYLSSGVLRPNGTTPDGDHMLLRVTLENGVHIADAGFGDGAIHALPLREGRYPAGFLEYRIERDTAVGLDTDAWTMHNPPTSNTAGFRFFNQPRALVFYNERCWELQTSPESGFVRTTVCQRMTRHALYTLRGAVLTTLTASGSTQRTLEDDRDYRRTLLETFKLDLPEAEELWATVWARHLERLARDGAPAP